MKKLLIVSILAITLMGAKTEDEKSVFTTTDIVWYGLDFTNAHFVGAFTQSGSAGEVTGTDLVKKWIPAWNDLMLNEAKKFDLLKAFSKQTVYYDINNMRSLNAKIDPEKCITQNPKEIEPDAIPKMIKKYTGDKQKGLGLAFIVENFDKISVNADVYVVFFDIASHKMLLCEKVSGKPSGIGVRNYWAGAIYQILKRIGDTDYEYWQQKNK